jgi:hypothetical protein
MDSRRPATVSAKVSGVPQRALAKACRRAGKPPIKGSEAVVVGMEEVHPVTVVQKGILSLATTQRKSLPRA